MNPRRVHVDRVRSGVIALPPREAHHLRDVLRMRSGDNVELFDDAGATASAQIVRLDDGGVSVQVAADEARPAPPERDQQVRIIVASAVPKGERADWMIEKLSELGVSRFIPLAAARSVVLPQGRNKRDRWMRIATESASQSRRSGVMSIDPLTSLADAIEAARGSGGIVLSTAPDARPILQVIQSSILQPPSSLALLVGPEGGWTDEELASFAAADLTSAKLTATILRVETAAVASAAVVAAAAFGVQSHR